MNKNHWRPCAIEWLQLAEPGCVGVLLRIEEAGEAVALRPILAINIAVDALRSMARGKRRL